MKYKISVIVLVYNTAEYLPECFDSLVNQTQTDIEIIAINDCSPDDSGIIMNYYEEKYPFFKSIHLEKNVGGATASTIAMKEAQGEYLIIMDGDDFRPLDSIEKLYEKAIATDADIVMGKPLLHQDEEFKPVTYQYERMVWEKERTIKQLSAYYDLLWDSFYWNKIFKRSFMTEYDIKMPEGVIYADRPMTHKAYIFSKKTVVITDVVYYWRKRSALSETSITQMQTDPKNFLDRLKSVVDMYDYILENHDTELQEVYLSKVIDRLLFMVPRIIDYKELRDIAIPAIKKLLVTMKNPYDNQLSIYRNLVIHSILTDDMYGLVELRVNDLAGPVRYENEKYLWETQYYKSLAVDYPDELFEINHIIEPRTISLADLSVSDGVLNISGLKIPFNQTMTKVAIELINKEDITQTYQVDLVEEKNSRNSYSLRKAIDEITDNQSGFYSLDILVTVNQEIHRVALTKNIYCVNRTAEELPLHGDSIFFSGQQLYISNHHIVSPRMLVDEKGITISGYPKAAYAFYLVNRTTKQKYFFSDNGEMSHYLTSELFYPQVGIFYDLYVKAINNNYRYANAEIKCTNKSVALTQQNIILEMYKTKFGNVSYKTRLAK